MRELSVSGTLALAAKYGIASAKTAGTAVGGGGQRPPFPLVVKADTAEHKSERGLVLLGIMDARGLEEAVRKVGGSDRAIIQEEVRGTEIIVGAKRDGVFGHVVMVGIGGTLAEAYSDVAFGVAPISESEAIEMARSLKGQKILEGFRGKPAVDMRALAKLIVRVAEMAVGENVRELDLNPVIATADGGLVAVDGRAVLD